MPRTCQQAAHSVLDGFLYGIERTAEQDRCTEPPFALGTGALEFWNFETSALGGR
jgi:hypothetical protein